METIGSLNTLIYCGLDQSDEDMPSFRDALKMNNNLIDRYIVAIREELEKIEEIEEE